MDRSRLDARCKNQINLTFTCQRGILTVLGMINDVLNPVERRKMSLKRKYTTLVTLNPLSF